MRGKGEKNVRESKPERENDLKTKDKRGLNKERQWFVYELRGLMRYCRKRPDIQAKWEKSSWLCLRGYDLYQWSDSVGS